MDGLEVDDKGNIPEEELIKSFWPNKIQPRTDAPIIKKIRNKLVATCQTEGANVGYKFKYKMTQVHGLGGGLT